MLMAITSFITLLFLCVASNKQYEPPEEDEVLEDLEGFLSKGHSERIQRIIGEDENNKIREILNSCEYTDDIRSKIMGFYDPKTNSFFMRFVDLYEFEIELLSNKNKNSVE